MLVSVDGVSVVVVASGVLYHMMNPVELIARISNIADAVYLWTHYFDRELLAHRLQAALPCRERGHLAQQQRGPHAARAHDGIDAEDQRGCRAG